MPATNKNFKQIANKHYYYHLIKNKIKEGFTLSDIFEYGIINDIKISRLIYELYYNKVSSKNVIFDASKTIGIK